MVTQPRNLVFADRAKARRAPADITEYEASIDLLSELEQERAGEPERGMDDAVKQYLKEIGRYPLLSGEQELELAERIANGDEEAKRMLI